MIKYIIDQQTLVAAVETKHTGDCRYSFAARTDAINANHPVILVNARPGKISVARKWEVAARKMDWLAGGTEVNPGEFLLRD